MAPRDRLHILVLQPAATEPYTSHAAMVERIAELRLATIEAFVDAILEGSDD